MRLIRTDFMSKGGERLSPCRGNLVNPSAPIAIGFPGSNSSSSKRTRFRVANVWWERFRNMLRSPDSPVLGRKPMAEDFTPRAVHRAVLQETLQHPATILPGALATVAALWSAAIDLSPASLIAMLGLSFVGAAAWVVN